jgi:hypothetical protein
MIPLVQLVIISLLVILNFWYKYNNFLKIILVTFHFSLVLITKISSPTENYNEVLYKLNNVKNKKNFEAFVLNL